MTPPPQPVSGGLRSAGRDRRPTRTGPRISIVTVVRNGEKHIEQSLRSIHDQTYDNLEHIVIDGGSTDRTLDILRAHEDRIDLWISEPDQGIYDAMNKGIRLTTGDLVGLLNSDDWYADDALEEVVSIHDLGGGRDRVIAGKWNIVLDRMNLSIEATPSFRFSAGMPLCHQAIFIPRAVYDAIGLYDTTYRYAADLDMAARLYAGRFPFVFSEKVLVHFRATGASDRHYRESVREASAIIRKHLPYWTYIGYRAVRLKFELLTRGASGLERILGKRASERMKSAYYRAKAGYSSTWKIR